MYNLKITVNGVDVWLTEFPSKIISSAIIAMIEELQDVDCIKDAVIKITKAE